MSEKLSDAGNMMDAAVFSLTDEIIFTPLAQEGALVWTRCQPPHAAEPFILASAAGEERAFQATQLLKNEYALRAQLSADWAIAPAGATLYHGRYALAYAVFPFTTLARHRVTTIADFLSLAIALCKPLRQMHALGLIHNDIKPGNFFFHPDGTLRLGGFGLSAAAAHAAQTRINVTGGTLAYMSPEHTARTRAALDNRSDLYSLGIVLYELLTGALPFDLSAGGPAEWAHHHIASAPRPPHQLRAAVPPMLSTIILRLLEKSPGNRYQTVTGLIADLRRCQATLAASGEIAMFTPGLQDRLPARWLADNLCLHHPQQGLLLSALERVAADGTPQLAIISGPQGSGKSSLIASALKKIQHQPALLAVSKADPWSPVLPYAAIAAAFRTLTLGLLGLASDKVACWKQRLSQALGDDQGLAVNLVPELGLLLESKPLSPGDMHSADARLRFNQMAQRLVTALAAPGRPLVLLIDDIHWIDQASLQLLAYLIENSEATALLMVVSHCDTEEGAEPHLTALRAAAAAPLEIRPQPLSVKAVARWLADLLQMRAAGLHELAALIHEKTGGNPLFTHEFFRRIVQDGLLAQPARQGKWHYDLAAIRARDYSENVASLMLQQLAALPQPTRTLLGCFASVGGSGKLALLSRAQGIPLSALRARLQPAIDARLITLAGEEYAFSHDRLQRAAQTLLSPEEACRLNVAVAGALTDALSQNDNNEALFLAAHHITSALERIRSAPDRDRYRAVCRRAAQRAQRTGDYASALRYLHTAKILLQHALQQAPDEAFTLDFQQAECEFLQGNLPAALTLCTQLMSMPGSREQKAQAACMMAEVHMRQSDMQLALETALAWLAVFGIHLSRQPEEEACLAARQALEARIGADPVAVFTALPVTTDGEAEAIMTLMISAGMFAAFAAPRLHFLLLCQIIQMTLDRGLCGASTAALAWYGVLLGRRFDEYRLGLRYSLLGRDLALRHPFQRCRGRTLLAVDLASAWVEPLDRTIDHAKACFTVAVDNGDLTAACFIIRHQTMNFLVRGDHLDGMLTTIERGLSFIRKRRFPDVEIILLIQRLYVTHLRNGSASAFSGAEALPETLIADKEGRQPIALTRFWFWLYRGMAHFMAGEYPQASHALAEAGRLRWVMPGYLHLLDYHLYSALALTIGLTPQSCSRTQRQEAQVHYAQIARWAEHNPATFADKAALLAAELARLDGDNAQAATLYETAIRLSGEAECHPINGLAHELASCFAKACGWQTASEAYGKGALTAWRRWGALAKLRQQERLWPHLAVAGQSTPFDTIAFAQNEASRDLESVLRAVRAMTEEINLDRLINTLMTLLLERAGAQRGMLIRLLDNQQPETQAWAETTADGVKVKMVKARPTATDMPLSVLAAVMRTGQEIRTGRPEDFSPFSQDTYLVTSGAAVLCVPMYKQARMVGVLYLENRLMPEMFTAEHSRIVRMLAAQAAVSLETARLYAELLQENIQRRRVEKELRASQTSLMLGEKISNTGTWRWELEQDLMFVSDEYARILGLPAQQHTLSMADFLTRVHPEDHPRISTLVTASVRNGVPMRAEFRVFRSDGSCRYILGVGKPVGEGERIDQYFGTITDVTARRQSEDAVRMAQADLARVARATTVGQLTASIAHEINQPLMSIVANAGASLRWLSRDPLKLTNARASLEEIISEGERAGNIIRGLQALTRNQQPSYSRVNLHHLVWHIMGLSRSELERRQILLEYALDAQDAFICGDSVQIQQVLLNLVMNAIDAMAEITRPRVLTLSSANPAPGKIRLGIADTGIGLCPEVRARLFDSFYTTKAQGMGMGLTISHGIIEKHQGELIAESRQPFGSLFAFTLPTSSDASADDADANAPAF